MEDTTTQCLTTPSKRVVKFLTREFDAFATPLGLTSDAKKAEFIGCGIATMSRIRAGKQNPGPRFIAMVYEAAKRQNHSVDPARFFDFRGDD